jgi:hypothetical protein
MTRKKVWGIIIGRMEINIMDNGREVWEVDRENYSIIMVIVMKDNLRMD